MNVVKFPDEACRPIHSRKPRRSKKGAPEEGAAGATVEQRFEASIIRLPNHTSPELAGEGADPIFAAIAAHRRACNINTRRVEVSSALTDDDPAKAAADIATGEAIDTMFDLARDLLKIRPTTAEGVSALLDHVCKGQSGHFDDDWRFPDHAVHVEEYDKGELFHLAMMKHISAALRSMRRPPSIIAASPGKVQPDPIFATIEEHRRVYAEFVSDCSDPDDKFETDDDALNVADRAAVALLAVEPNTIAGAAALLAYYAEQTFLDETFFPERVQSGKDEGEPFAAVLARSVSVAMNRITARVEE